jgi:hypothetical protein
LGWARYSIYNKRKGEQRLLDLRKPYFFLF